MVAASVAGPSLIVHKQFNVKNLTGAIRFRLTPAATTAAAELSSLMKREDGVFKAVRLLHDKLPLGNLRCDILSNQPAVWLCKRAGKHIKLSKAAAGALVASQDRSQEAINEIETVRIVNRRGILEGFADLVVRPYEGGREAGAVGAAKGVGMGTYIVGLEFDVAD
ncbi:hypothetical protein FZEAL_5194 [Fusarium zealandicum]|uniref:Uncharacterized protein n=1 Tax=Fusarium zealandicum TaxID=1053134 RepID=A0A8H4UKN9_9HYPO|nr:hypothetical protein FZEAL_5194 [Fusarium zealandicum]